MPQIVQFQTEIARFCASYRLILENRNIKGFECWHTICLLYNVSLTKPRMLG